MTYRLVTPIGVQNFGIGESKSLAERFAVLSGSKERKFHGEELHGHA